MYKGKLPMRVHRGLQAEQKPSPRAAWLRISIVIVACLTARLLWSQTPEQKKISSLAPAADLIEQVDAYLKQIGDALADRDEFEGAGQSRAWRDANTLAVLALVLSASDESHPLKSSLPAMLKGARALAAAEENFDAAQKAFGEIQSARAGKSESNEAIAWEAVASLPALMKQVPLVHAGLRRNVAPARLARTAQQSAALSATLAAIAEVALLDDEYAKTPDEGKAWRAYCVQMRDAAGEVNSAVHAQDQARVDAGMKRMLESCDACHAKFRQR
jgi:hypothetical protein